MRKPELLIATAVLCAGPVRAQPPPSFEVVSIKPTLAGDGTSGITTSKGRVAARNVTVKRCIRGAYGIPEDQVIGGPKWIDDNRYDIDARAAGPAGDSEMMPMLQTLLAERFKLTFHRESKPLNGYALVLGKGGLKIKPSDPDAESKTNTSRGSLEAASCTMSQLALKISLALHQPVVDLTETKGAFDFTLKWTPDDMQAKPGTDAAQAPSLFSAVQEQLGLKLEPRKIPTEVFVIDHAEVPSEN